MAIGRNKMVRNWHILDNDKKKVILYGCGRSGTRYMARVFGVLGIQVGHEKCGPNGICSWYLVEKSRAGLLQKRLVDHDIKYIHLVRNPLKVIASMRKIEVLAMIPDAKNRIEKRAGLNFFETTHPQYIHLRRSNPFEYITQWWVTWNKEAENNLPKDKRIRVEDVRTEAAVKCLCEILELEYTSEKHHRILGLGRNIHTLSRRTTRAVHTIKPEVEEELTLEKLDKYIDNRELLGELVQMAFRYGYNIIDT